VELFDYSGESSHLTARSVVSQPNGELVVGGSGTYEDLSAEPWQPQRRFRFLWLARLTASGALDRSFGEGGMSIPYGAHAESVGPGLVEPRPGGFFLVGATENEREQAQMTVWGLTSRGAPDPSFGSHGVLVVPDIPSEVRELVSAATVDEAGRLLIAGTTGNRTRPEIVRIDPDGQLDHDFGQEGVAQGPPQSTFNALTVEPSGRVLAAGLLEPEGPEELTAPSVELEREGKQEDDAMIERFIATNSPSVSSAPESASVRLVKTHLVTRKNGEVTISLACVGTGTCRGMLTITATGKQRHRKPTILGAARFAIAVSQAPAVELVLDATGRALMRAHHGRLAARLTIVKSSPHPRRSRTDPVELRFT
jgi:uncharacterized delta-60 repeat protein